MQNQRISNPLISLGSKYFGSPNGDDFEPSKVVFSSRPVFCPTNRVTEAGGSIEHRAAGGGPDQRMGFLSVGGHQGIDLSDAVLGADKPAARPELSILSPYLLWRRDT